MPIIASLKQIVGFRKAIKFALTSNLHINKKVLIYDNTWKFFECCRKCSICFKAQLFKRYPQTQEISIMYSNEPSFHGFKLPEDLLDYRSHESKKRLIRCMSEGTAMPFLALSSCYKPQSHPAYCGFSTLVMVLNALRVDPKRLWKTPWRWFTEELLEKSVELTELELIRKTGITMEQFQNVSERNGATCKLVRPSGDSEEGYEEFLSDLYHVCAGRKSRWQDHGLIRSDDNSRNMNLALSEEYPNKLMAVSFYREALEQHGNGHYSPVAAFDLKTNSVLVLDTARFKYPPYWVPTRDLYRSMVPIDTATEKSRGYFLMKRNDVGKIQDLSLYLED